MEMMYVVLIEYDVMMKFSLMFLFREICENIRNIGEYGRELDDV